MANDLSYEWKLDNILILLFIERIENGTHRTPMMAGSFFQMLSNSFDSRENPIGAMMVLDKFKRGGLIEWTGEKNEMPTLTDNGATFIWDEHGYSKMEKERLIKEADSERERTKNRFWWTPIVISIVSVIISASSVLYTNLGKRKTVSKEDMQEKIEVSKQTVLHFVDSLYQTNHDTQHPKVQKTK